MMHDARALGSANRWSSTVDRSRIDSTRVFIDRSTSPKMTQRTLHTPRTNVAERMRHGVARRGETRDLEGAWGQGEPSPRIHRAVICTARFVAAGDGHARLGAVDCGPSTPMCPSPLTGESRWGALTGFFLFLFLGRGRTSTSASIQSDLRLVSLLDPTLEARTQPLLCLRRRPKWQGVHFG